MCALTRAHAQVENFKSTASGGIVIITYDLKSADPSQKFKIAVYSSHDNYANPVSHVTGAVGENVSPGKGLRIEWDAKSSLPQDFNKETTVRLRGVAMVQAKPLEKTVYKKGGNVELAWSGGGKSDKINIELMREDAVYKTLAEGADNSNAFSWKIPKNLKAGKTYSLRLTDVTNPMQPSATSQFEIKAKIPMVVKIAAAAVVIGGGIYLATQGNNDDDKLPGIDINPNDN